MSKQWTIINDKNQKHEARKVDRNANFYNRYNLGFKNKLK